MAQGRLGSALSNLTKQKLIPATVVDVLGRKCSVRLSGTGGKITGILYTGLQPDIGDEVMIDYRGLNNPIALTTHDTLPTHLETKKAKKKVVVLKPIEKIFTWGIKSYNAGLETVNKINGVVWSLELNMFVASDFRSEYIDGAWVYTNLVYTSPDGIEWAEHEVLVSKIGKIIWSQKLSLLVSFGATSGNGIDWVEHATPEINARWAGMCYSQKLDLFVRVSQRHYEYPEDTPVAISSDGGESWELQAAPMGFWSEVCWSPELGVFVALEGYSDSAPYKVMTSPDGINWSLFETSLLMGVTALAWSSDLGIFIAAGWYSGSFQTSPDGINWTLHAGSLAQTTDIMWVKEAGMFMLLQSGLSRVKTSPNGLDWTEHTFSPTIRGVCFGAWSKYLSTLVVIGSEVSSGG